MNWQALLDEILAGRDQQDIPRPVYDERPVLYGFTSGTGAGVPLRHPALNPHDSRYVHQHCQVGLCQTETLAWLLGLAQLALLLHENKGPVVWRRRPFVRGETVFDRDGLWYTPLWRCSVFVEAKK